MKARTCQLSPHSDHDHDHDDDDANDHDHDHDDDDANDHDDDDANDDDVNDDDALAMFLMMMVFRIGVRTVRTRPALFDKCLRYFISKE